MSEGKTLFELVGGRACLERVHKIFYDKIYADPILSQFFKDRVQETQEKQQTDFMTQPMGGEAIYCGRFPVPAHSHMYITEEIFELRTRLLTESLIEAGVPPELREKWLRIDEAFRQGIVKKSVEDCKKRYATDEIMIAVDPNKADPKKKAA